jgi:hypothetical protein
MIIKFHPDGYVVLKQGGSLICKAIPEEVAEIIGKAMSPLPSGATGASYDVDSQESVYFDKFKQLDIKLDWGDAKLIAEKVADFEHLNLVHLSKEKYVHGISPLNDCPEDLLEEYGLEQYEDEQGERQVRAKSE